MLDTVNLLLSHQCADEVERMVAHWSTCVESDSIVLAYGGSRAEFDRIAHGRKFFVTDPRLRTRDHQRELQSYTGIFRSALEFLNREEVQTEHVHFAEYDHVPLGPGLNDKQTERLRSEDADVLGFHVHRIDGTSHPHFLYHAATSEFCAHWRRISRRRDSEVVLSMFGTGSFWTWEAFHAVTSADEAVPCYMEVYLPTTAHHLGFRVRDFGSQNEFVTNLGDRCGEIDRARAAGAWTIHPCKHLWTSA